MTRFHYWTRRVAAVLVGLVFFVAGSLKLMDPVGAGLVCAEYFKFFCLAFLVPASKWIGVILALLEAVTGVGLITGVFRKSFAIVASTLVGLFTILTFILWIKNPSFDCGCFGEAIHLSHGQTLVKNLILLALSAWAFIPFHGFGTWRGGKMIPFFLVCAALAGITIRSWLYMPFKDFTPFVYSSRLLAAEMDNPDSGEADFVTVFIYEKDGLQDSFTGDQLPDSTWTFVRSEAMAKEDNYLQNSYPELAFTDACGEFCDYMATGESVLVCSVYEPSSMSVSRWKRTSEFLEDALEFGFTPLLLVTAEPGSDFLPAELDSKDAMLLTESAYVSPYRTLVSLNRSNGGVTYFNEGDLVRKWPARKLPSRSDLQDISLSDTTAVTISAQTRGSIHFQAFFLYSLAVLFLL